MKTYLSDPEHDASAHVGYLRYDEVEELVRHLPGKPIYWNGEALVETAEVQVVVEDGRAAWEITLTFG